MAEDLLAGNSTHTARPESGATAKADRPAEPPPAPAAATVSPSDPPRREVADADTAIVSESLSPGIRKLISRVEGVFDETRAGDHGEPEEYAAISVDEGSADDLERDLKEIEKLRTELQGLRHRINTSGD